MKFQFNVGVRVSGNTLLEACTYMYISTLELSELLFSSSRVSLLLYVCKRPSIKLWQQGSALRVERISNSLLTEMDFNGNIKYGHVLLLHTLDEFEFFANAFFLSIASRALYEFSILQSKVKYYNSSQTQSCYLNVEAKMFSRSVENM